MIPALILSIALTAYVTFNVYNRSREMLSGNVERTQAELNQLLEEAYQVGRSVEEDGEIRTALEELMPPNRKGAWRNSPSTTN